MLNPDTNKSTGGRRFILPLVFIGAMFAVLWWRAPSADDHGLVRDQFAGMTMGTTWSVVVAVEEGFDVSGVDEAVADALDGVDLAMSTYKPNSELMRLNRYPVGSVMKISAGLRRVLEKAAEVSAATGGAFDITVGPLVDRWGFGPEDLETEPTISEIDSLLLRVDWKSVGLSPEGASRARDGLRLDLSAIAKGFGADMAATALEELGISRYLVEVGGEIRVRGHSDHGRPWQIGVEKPDTMTRESVAVLGLTSGGMATSGDYRNYREVDGKRVSHTIDPRTGWPIDHRLASVTVLADDCVTADAWATALNVLGPDEGLSLAKEAGIAVYMLVRTADGEFRPRMTDSFADRNANRRESDEGNPS